MMTFTDLTHTREFLGLGGAAVDGGLDGFFLGAAFDAVAHLDVVGK